MIVNIVRPVYKGLIQINQYEVAFESEKSYYIVTVEVAARNYASAKKIVEERYNPKQVYSVRLIKGDIWWHNSEEYLSTISWQRKKRRWL